MQYLLRAISGPLAGAVYVLGPRTTLGRASDCDIQVLHEGVSRQHAKVTVDGQGNTYLTDLGSDNGTFVDGHRVSRHQLQPGEVFRILGSQFVYERVDAAGAVTSAAFERKVKSGDSLRQTANLRDELAGFRSGGSARSAGLVRSERGRPTSRPQAAAPAPSGARPGSLVSGARAMTPEGPPATREMPASEQVRAARRSLRGTEGRVEHVEAEDEQSPSNRTLGYGERVRYPFDRRRPVTEAGSAYGLHAEKGAQRERVTIAPASLARATTPLGELPDVDLLEGEGPTPELARDRDRGPGAVEAAPAEPPMDRPAVAIPRSGPSQARSRIAPPLETPGSMRPHVTMSGMPQARAEAARAGPTPGPSRAEPTPVEHTARWAARGPARRAPSEAISRRKGVTAEYGAMHRGPAVEPSPSPGADASAPVTGARDDASPERPLASRLVVRPAAPGEGAKLRPWKTGPSTPSDLELDDDGLARTLPRVRRSTPTTPPRDEPGPEAYEHDGVSVPFEPEPGDSVEETIRFHRVDPSKLRLDDDGNVVEAETARPAEADLLVEAEEPAAPEEIDPLGQVLRGVANGGNEMTTEPSHEPALVPGPDGGLEVLVDILEYRDLRLRTLRGELLPSSASARLSTLEEHLQRNDASPDDPAAMRRYHRFPCGAQAQLSWRRAEGRTSTVEIALADLSAGGAKVLLRGAPLSVGAEVWLTFDLLPADRSRLPDPEADAVILAGRVVWANTGDGELGLIFAGAPRYERDMAVGV